MTTNAEPNKHKLLITAWLANEMSDPQSQQFKHLIATSPEFKAQLEQSKREYNNLFDASHYIAETPVSDSVVATVSQISTQQHKNSATDNTDSSETKEIQHSLEKNAEETPRNNSKNHSNTTKTTSSITAESGHTNTGIEHSMKTIVTQSSKNIVKEKESRWFTPLSLTAIAFLLGLLVLFYLYSDSMFAGSPSFRAQLNNALSNSLSGNTIPINEKQKIYINLTFLDKESRYCREYFITQPEQPTLHRIACRTHLQWQTQIESETQTSPLDNETNQLSSASKNSVAKINAFLNDKRLSDALDHDNEIKAIKKMWLILPSSKEY